MMTNNDFNGQFLSLVEEWGKHLDNTLLPELHELYRGQQMAVKSLEDIFQKKGLLREDPYRHETRIVDVEPVTCDSVPDSEKKDALAVRLSVFELTLDYINNYYQFNTVFITIDRIKKLSVFNKAFDWHNVSGSATSYNTKILADLVRDIKGGSDSVAAGMVSEAIIRLDRSMGRINWLLKNLTEYHKENYKALIRRELIPFLENNGLLEGHTVEELPNIFKLNFRKCIKDQPFYTELVNEVVNESFSSKADNYQFQVLEKIRSNVKLEGGKKVQAVDLKGMIVDCVRMLGSVSPQLEALIKKMEDNRLLIENSRTGFWDKFGKFMRKLFNIKDKPVEIEVEIVDPITHGVKRDTVEYYGFLEEIKKRARLYSALALKGSPAYQKFIQSSEEQIYKFATENIDQSQEILKKLEGLDLYFKKAAPYDVKDKIKGFKIEIGTIKNTLLKANQKRGEYTSFIEEQKQMEKLGIKDY